MTQASATILSIHDMKGSTLRNRFAVAPMTRVSATATGLPTQVMHDYYLRFAKGGFGLVITEGLYTDKAYSQGYRMQPGMADDEQALAWAPITRALHEKGAKVFAQLMHAGALSQENRFKPSTVGPSSVRPVGSQMAFYYGDGPYAEPGTITDEEINEVVRGFVEASKRAVSIAGFDGIEIHGANGYLLDQFLTANTNQRTDRWGGDIYGRVSLLVAIMKSVKAELGNQAPVGIRISQGKVNDFSHKWPGQAADAEVVFHSLAEAGADFIHVTEFEAWAPAFEGEEDSLLALARRFAPNVTLIANGGLHDAERATQALKDGADIVALGRGALANPDYPRRMKASLHGREFDKSILEPIANIKNFELSFNSIGIE